MRITCLLIFVSLLVGCNLRPSIRGNEGSLESKTETVEETIPSDQAVEFEGVSFHYDPRVFGDVKKLDVEAKAVDLHHLKKRPESSHVEGLESALRVRKIQARQCTDH